MKPSVARTLGLIGAVVAYAAVNGAHAQALRNSPYLVSSGSVFMSDEFAATGPAGTLWQSMTARHDIQRWRLELGALRQIARDEPYAMPSSAPTWYESMAHTASDPAFAGTTLALSYRPNIEGWETRITAKEFVASPYQKARLASVDYRALLVSMERSFGRTNVEAAFGYKNRAGNARLAVRNGFYGYAGAVWNADERHGVELFVDYRQVSPGGRVSAEVSAKYAYALSSRASLEAYATQGVTAGNRDIAAGLLLALRF